MVSNYILKDICGDLCESYRDGERHMLLVNDSRIRKYLRPTLLGNLSQLLQDSVSCGIVLVADFF